MVVTPPDDAMERSAEQLLSALLCMARHVPAASAALKSGEWERGRFVGTELHGKTLCLLGIDGVAAKLAAFARALGYSSARVCQRAHGANERARMCAPAACVSSRMIQRLLWSPLGLWVSTRFIPPHARHMPSAPLTRHATQVTSLQQLFGAADVLSVHTPLTKVRRNAHAHDDAPGIMLLLTHPSHVRQETRHLVGPTNLARCPRGFFLLSAGCTGVVDWHAVQATVQAGKAWCPLSGVCPRSLMRLLRRLLGWR